MKDYMLSLIIWLILPGLLMLSNVMLNWNILFFILELVWLGFGIFMLSIDS